MNEVYLALMAGFEEMRKQFVDRIILELHELDTSGLENITLSSVSYYPFDLCTEDEKKLIITCKSYSVVALIQKDTNGIINYKDNGIERYDRLFLNHRYLTKGGGFIGDKVKEFAAALEDNGWKKEFIGQKIAKGISDYHNTTKELIEKGGIYDKLRRMDKRKYAPFEFILKGIQKRLENTGKKQK